MRVPLCARWSKPQNVIVTARSDAAPTGQPRCQLLPSSAVVTVRLPQWNGAAWETVRCAGFLAAELGVRVGVGLRAGIDVVAIGDAEGVDRVGEGVGAAAGVP